MKGGEGAEGGEESDVVNVVNARGIEQGSECSDAASVSEEDSGLLWAGRRGAGAWGVCSFLSQGLGLVYR